MLCAVLSGSAAAQTTALSSTSSSSASSSSAGAAQQALPISGDQILAHARHVLDWYHHVSQTEQLPGAAEDVVDRDRLHDQALTVARLAFEVGNAATPLVTAGPGARRPGAETSALGQLRQATRTLSERARSIELDLAAVNGQLKSTRGAAARKTLISRRDSLTASLGLVREGQSSVQQMLEFASRAASAGGEGQSALASQLGELERSLPAARPGTGNTPSAAPAPAAPTTEGFRPESAGIVALVSQGFSLRGTQSQMTSLRKETDALDVEVQGLRKAVIGQVREIMTQSIAATQAGSPQEMLTEKQAIEAGTARFKALSGVLVPLSEEAVMLANVRSTLDEWSHGVDVRLLSVTRYFVLRLGVLLASVLGVLIVSELWRRATLRYVRDPGRRRPFLVLRRLLVGLALVIVIAFGLASEVGSLATVLGFLTAGIAVTLQNVILSVVAYFFLIGRYGVQVGDRITLAGVTGRVVDVSLLRLFLLELTGPDLHSTGRLVVLSNSVLFQPAALYKQIPGADYVWHTVTLMVTPGKDVVEASRRLNAAARSVFDHYQPVIEQRQELLRQHIDFEAALPQPEVQVEVADGGLRCSVRYPVTVEHAPAIDQQMLEALRAALEQGGELKLAETGGVTLKADT